MMKKVIVGLDPGIAAWGMCAVDVETREVLAVHYHKNSDSYVFPYKQFKSWQAMSAAWGNLFDNYDIQAVAIETLPIGRGVVYVHQSIGLFLSMLFDTPKLYDCYTYTPAQWKKEVTGQGNRKKKDCRSFIREQTGWQPEGRVSPDAYDSVGVALCHLSKEGKNEV